MQRKSRHLLLMVKQQRSAIVRQAMSGLKSFVAPAVHLLERTVITRITTAVLPTIMCATIKLITVKLRQEQNQVLKPRDTAMKDLLPSGK